MESASHVLGNTIVDVQSGMDGPPCQKGRSMIKGKFVATIEIDIAIDENTANLLPFEKLKTAVHNDMETAVKDMLCEEFGDIATVKVTKTFADLYRTEVT